MPASCILIIDNSDTRIASFEDCIHEGEAFYSCAENEIVYFFQMLILIMQK